MTFCCCDQQTIGSVGGCETGVITGGNNKITKVLSGGINFGDGAVSQSAMSGGIIVANGGVSQCHSYVK